MRKTINLLLVILMIQLASACCESSYGTTTAIESRFFILDGIDILEFDQQNTIIKDNLLIQVVVNYQYETACNNDRKKKIGEVEVLTASVTPFCNPETTYLDKIESIKVEALDLENENTSIDITNQVDSYYDEISISEYFSQDVSGITNVFLKLSDSSNVPDHSEFLIEITLDNGLKLDSSAGVVKFN